jgi:hypothetical protein
MEAARSSKPLASIHLTAVRHIPENNNLKYIWLWYEFFSSNSYYRRNWEKEISGILSVFPLLTLKLPTLLHRSLHKFKLFAPDGPCNVRYYVIQYFNSCYDLLFPDMKSYEALYTLWRILVSRLFDVEMHTMCSWVKDCKIIQRNISSVPKIFKLLKRKSLTLLSSSRGWRRNQQTYSKKYITNKPFSNYRIGCKSCPNSIPIHVCPRIG